MKHQRGVALSGLISWGFVIFFVAVLGIKVTPDVINYYKIKKIVASTALRAEGKTVPEIRADFDRLAVVDQVDDVIKGADLDVSKEGNAVVVAFAYEKRIHLFSFVNLLLDFQGESRQQR
ncbi:MAG: DUF4845 domain-containing protein [Candidatus Accumulibacter sp.]|jgi:hypothetical protein|nr:DUF4845 domain-containing protein [Accumulibacter sp.]